MNRSAIEHCLYLMDQAFEGDPAQPGRSWHGFLVNLRSVPFEDWRWAPVGGHRTVFQFVEEVGGCKYVYESQAFGDRSMHWNKPGSVPPFDAEGPVESIIDWVREGHRRMRDAVAALQDDSELLRPRLSPQGEMQETRWIIKTTIEHDLYHAGEINHLRALRQGNDW